MLNQNKLLWVSNFKIYLSDEALKDLRQIIDSSEKISWIVDFSEFTVHFLGTSHVSLLMEIEVK